MYVKILAHVHFSFPTVRLKTMCSATYALLQQPFPQELGKLQVSSCSQVHAHLDDNLSKRELSKCFIDFYTCQ